MEASIPQTSQGFLCTIVNGEVKGGNFALVEMMLLRSHSEKVKHKNEQTNYEGVSLSTPGGPLPAEYYYRYVKTE